MTIRLIYSGQKIVKMDSIEYHKRIDVAKGCSCTLAINLHNNHTAKEGDMYNKLFIFAVLVLLLTVSLASGQSWDKTKGFGINGGLVKFVGGEVDRAALGYSGGLSLRYGNSPYTMFDLNLGYGSFTPSIVGSRYQSDKNSDFRTFLFPIHLAFKATPFKDSRFKPYATAALGVLLWDLRNVKGTDVSLFSDYKFYWGTKVYDEVQKEITVLFGLGLETYLSQSFALDLLIGFNGISTTPYLDNVGVGDNNEGYIEGRATLAYYFGYYKDTDGDGIEDKKDADPLRPEDFDGFQDEDGAPDEDNDGDGIPDLKDRAPNDAEDKDGFQDEDGIPDPDNDNDGIVDSKDKAPNEPEDMDNFQDDDGAPDIDNDNDGVLDKDDKCPGTDATVARGEDTKETVNGYQDDDGCPDKKPAPAPVPQLEKKGAKLILQGVNFETASAELTADSYTILDQVIEGLKDNQEVELEIRGYTDSQGAAAANQKLSERRAVTVMQYLVNKGISANRLKAVGYGENDPIDTNSTPEGRAKNRRIEFVRTK